MVPSVTAEAGCVRNIRHMVSVRKAASRKLPYARILLLADTPREGTLR